MIFHNQLHLDEHSEREIQVSRLHVAMYLTNRLVLLLSLMATTFVQWPPWPSNLTVGLTHHKKYSRMNIHVSHLTIVYKTEALLVQFSNYSVSSITSHSKSAGSGFNLYINPINLFQNLLIVIFFLPKKHSLFKFSLPKHTRKMRGLSTFLITSTLLALGLTAPTGELEDRGLSILEDRGNNRPSTPPDASGNQVVPGAPSKAGSRKAPFPLDDFIKEWFDVDRVQETLKYAAEFTKGGYEGWVQVEWDLVAKRYKTVNVKPSDREVLVYEQSEQDKAEGKKEKRADFVFASTDKTKGLIVELKTENQKSEGATFIREVKADVAKLRGKYKKEYDSTDYTKVSIAIAWSEKAHGEMNKGDLKGMLPLQGIETKLSGGPTLKVYRLDVEPDTNPDPVEQLVDQFGDTAISDSDCEDKQKRSSSECQRKTGSSNANTGTKDNSGSQGKPATAGQSGKAGNKNQAGKKGKAGRKSKAGGRRIKS